MNDQDIKQAYDNAAKAILQLNEEISDLTIKFGSSSRITKSKQEQLIAFSKLYEVSAEALQAIEPKQKEYDYDSRYWLEDAIIGACIIERGSFQKVNKILCADDFLIENNATLFKAMVDLKGNPIDMVTVHHQVYRTIKKSLAVYIAETASKVSSAANIQYHAFCLFEISFRQQFVNRINGHQLIRKLNDLSLDFFDVIEEVSSQLIASGDKELKQEVLLLNYELSERIQQIYAAQ